MGIKVLSTDTHLSLFDPVLSPLISSFARARRGRPQRRAGSAAA